MAWMGQDDCSGMSPGSTDSGEDVLGAPHIDGECVQWYNQDSVQYKTFIINRNKQLQSMKDLGCSRKFVGISLAQLGLRK